MQYRINPRNGDKLSVLGFGCMRFSGGEQEVARQVAFAVEQGVNYFDTAYIYPGNEVMLGKALAKGNLRDCVKIATKLPHYLVSKSADFERMFASQLTRLQTNQIDYYMIHMLTGLAEWERMVSLGVVQWIEGKKASGEIANIGFSYHGGRDEFRKLIDAYDWEFCMIQYNYYDERNQAGKSGLEYAASKNVPVMVMEPLRGGRLTANLPREAAELFAEAPGGYSPAEWGLRWVWNHPEVLTVLSGMSSMEMLEENIRAAGKAEPNMLAAEDLALLERVRALIAAKTKVPCTGCNYCMPCPAGVDIPLCFSLRNDLELARPWKILFNYVVYANNHNASRCTRCGKCEKHCPQSIPIRDALGEVVHRIERFPYKPMRFVVKKAMRLR